MYVCNRFYPDEIPKRQAISRVFPKLSLAPGCSNLAFNNPPKMHLTNTFPADKLRGSSVADPHSSGENWDCIRSVKSGVRSPQQLETADRQLRYIPRRTSEQASMLTGSLHSRATVWQWLGLEA